MSNLELLQNELNIARETFQKASDKFKRKQDAPANNMRSIADLKSFKLEMIDSEIAMLNAELEVLAETEEIQDRDNSVGKRQVELDLVRKQIIEGLDKVGINLASCYITSETQASIYLDNSFVKQSLLYKAAKEKLAQAGQQALIVEQEAKRVANALCNAEKARSEFFAALRQGI